MMKTSLKSTFYFDHDYSSRNDDKILELRSEFKNEGYGIFWCCIEAMAEHGDGRIDAALVGGLSMTLGVTKEFLQNLLDFCVKIKLFEKDENGYFSRRILEHLAFRKKCSENGKRGAKIKREKKAPLKPPLTTPSSSKGKERIVKETKEFNNVYATECVKGGVGEGAASAPTPAQEATGFFDQKDFDPYKTKFIETGYDPKLLDTEFMKFWAYWTEPTGSGKKQRWQTQPTFEISRRLITWMSRATTRAPDKGKVRSVVIN